MNESIKLSKAEASKIQKLCSSFYGAPIPRGGEETPEKTAARKAYGTGIAKLAKKHFDLTLTAEEEIRAGAALRIHEGAYRGERASVGVRSAAAAPLLKEWCDLLTLSLNSKWDVYSGNNFVV